MLEIDSIRIAGYKPIEQMEVDSKQINIITGRNNSGKTSLLESIDLLFNPSNISKFDDNINYLINREADVCKINGEYNTGQRTLTAFTTDRSADRRRGLGIREPTDEEVIDFFHKTLYDILELNRGYPISPSPVDQLSFNNETNAEEEMREVLRETVSNLSAQELLESGAKDNIIILFTDEDMYPFIYLGDYYDQLRKSLVGAARTRLDATQLINVSGDMDSPDKDWMLTRSLNRLLAPRFGRSRFIGDAPADVDGVEFIENVIGDSSQFDLDKENAAIRVQKIEEYIRNNDIIDGIQDFSFDKVVIQDEYDDRPYEVPYEFLGEGVKIIVRVLWSLFDEDNRGEVLLLEEPENHMHPGYIENMSKTLVDVVEESNIQLYLTTHNIDFIESFFSPHIKGDRQEFLENEFKLIQMTDPIPKSMGYEECRMKVDELDLDLRGV